MPCLLSHSSLYPNLKKFGIDKSDIPDLARVCDFIHHAFFCFSFVLERRRRKGRHSRPSEGIFCYLFLRFSALFLTCLHTHANLCLLLLLFALGRPPVVCWKPSRHTWPTWRVVKLVLPQPRQVGQVWHL